MRLSNVLQFYIRYRRVPGALRFGKHRVIPPISVNFKRKVAELMVIERANIEILNKPYLTEEAEMAYYRVVERVPYKNEKQLKLEETQEKLKSIAPHYRTEDLLCHLNVTKKWE